MLSDLSIRRPVLAIVANLLIIIAGLSALFSIPVRELPNIDRPVVSVATNYPGAAPEAVDTEVTEVIEGALSGVEGVASLTSRSSLGSSRTTIEFVESRDMESASNDVRDAVSRAAGRLPDGTDNPRVLKADSDAQPIIRLSATSTHATPEEITDYLNRFVVDRLSALDGVAQVDIFGQREGAVRIWIDRQALAARNLTVSDIENALRRANLELPAGSLDSESRSLAVRTDTRFRTVDDFRNLVIAHVDGRPVRLIDVAEIEAGVENRDSSVRSNGKESIGIGIIRQGTANTIAVSGLVRETLADIRASLPEGMAIEITADDAIFIEGSVSEVVRALVIAMVLVVLVILLFLASPRATLIPTVTIPVSLIGALAGIYLLGFSINVLTLLALVLAIGLVVDDAIVVLENIERRIEQGEGPMAAAMLGTRQVLFAVLATSATLIAVFIPISMLGGSVGRLFSEFGFVLAAAVIISTFVALTLCPMLASRILARKENVSVVVQAVDNGFKRIASGYRFLLQGALAMPVVVIATAVAFAGAGGYLYLTLPQELAPQEDRGAFMVPVNAPQGVSVSYTDRQVRAVEDMLQPLLDSGEAERVYAIVGMGRSSSGFIMVTLADWAERERSQAEIIGEVASAIGSLPGARAFPVSPGGLGIRGGSQPLQFVIGGPDYDSLIEWSEAFMERAEAETPLQNLSMDFDRNQLQLSIQVDRARADDLGVSVEEIGRTVQTLLGGREVTSLFEGGREYPVMLQARAEDRRDPEDITNIFVRGAENTLIPLSAIATVEDTAAAPTLRRVDRLRAVTVSASLAPGYDLAQAVSDVERIAAEVLPPNARLSFSGQAQQFLETSGGVAFTFGVALLIVFLVLAAQFESFIHPLIIILTVPLAISAAILALYLTGVSLNIYSQIGLILLIGLMAKNGILIVEFANQMRERGSSVHEAILEGSVIRFRPVLMTVVSTVLGAIPLVLASGAGAEGRYAIGVVIIGGLGIASIMTLFVTPAIYLCLAGFAKPRNAAAMRLEAELAASQKGV